MLGVNRITLLGHLAEDPELKTADNGKAQLSFPLIVSERVLNQGEPHDRKQFFRIILRGKRAESLAKILTRGSAVFCEGPIRSYSYTDDDGNERHNWVVYPDTIMGRQRGVQEHRSASDDHA